MVFLQTRFDLKPQKRGFHLVHREILEGSPDISGIAIGLLHLHIAHTSASLTLNENASFEVRTDMEGIFNSLVPENDPAYTHTLEGPDDMPAHAKASLLGAAVVLPITGGRLNLGTWQGIYLCEHRNHGGRRKIVATAMGVPEQ
jgi:secondary thiamine-phosphate synthase enzyme